jgi:hypothetical protein
MMLSDKQRQRNLENISYVRSLLKQNQEHDDSPQTRPEHSGMAQDQGQDPST